MKNIIYIFIALLTSITLTSCYDDDPINEVIIQDVSEITIAISSASMIISEEGNTIGFTVTIPAAIDSDAAVEAKLSYIGGEVLTTVNVPSGSTTASGSIVLPETGNNGINDLGGRATDVQLSATGYLPENVMAGESSVFNVTSNIVDFTAFDRIQWPYGNDVISGRMTALFDWENPAANDLDMLMFNADTFAQVESAGSGSRWETDIFNDTHPDGNYFVAIDVFAGSGDIPWEIFFVHPNQSTVSYFNGVFTDAASGDFIFPVIDFTKSTDADGVVSYTFSQP